MCDESFSYISGAETSISLKYGKTLSHTDDPKIVLILSHKPKCITT